MQVSTSVQQRPKVGYKQQAKDLTFSLYGDLEPEQGFYKCHDSIYDVPEGQRIPDLKKAKIKAISPNVDNQYKQRRLSLDSGRGTSVAGNLFCLNILFSLE